MHILSGDTDDDVLTETETETTGSSYLGCFSDLEEDRIFTFEASAAAMTPDVSVADGYNEQNRFQRRFL